VHVAGCTPNPSAPWVTQQAPSADLDAGRMPRVVPLPDSPTGTRNSPTVFDDVFRGSGLEIIRTPFRVPQANGVAERFVRTVRSECLDWLLILSDQHLQRVLDVFVEHYNGHRPHRALALTPPCPARSPVTPLAEWGRGSCPASRIVSVVWFTSTSWRRDQILEPYRSSGRGSSVNQRPYGLPDRASTVGGGWAFAGSSSRGPLSASQGAGNCCRRAQVAGRQSCR